MHDTLAHPMKGRPIGRRTGFADYPCDAAHFFPNPDGSAKITDFGGALANDSLDDKQSAARSCAKIR
jgi:hypothetical protein